MTSINTNSAATTALRTLQATSRSLETTQNRISTGLKIGEAKDNAAYWSISTSLKSDNKSLATVKDALNLGAATVDTAYEGLNKAREVLDEIQSKLTSASQDGLDRNVIQEEIKSLQEQLKGISSSSIFSGENWLSIDSSAAGYNAEKSIVSGLGRDASGNITISSIKVDTSGAALFDSSATANGIIDSAKALVSGGVGLTVGGVNAAAAPTTSALVFGTPTTGVAATPGGVATVAVGTLDLAGIKSGDKVNFNLTVGGATAAVSLATEGLTEGNFATRLASAIDAAVGTGQVTVAFNATTKAVSLSTVATGAGASIAVAAPAAANGDGVVTSTLGINSTSPLPSYGTASAATVTAGTYTTATTAAGDVLTFKFQYDGEVYQATHTFAGATANEAAFQTILNNAIDSATRVTDGVALGANKVTATVVAGANGISFATDATGEAKSIGIFDVEATDNAGVAKPASALGLVASSGVDYGSATGASISAGVFNTSGVKQGDTLTFAVNVNGSTATNISVSTAGLSTTTSAADRALFQSNLQAALNAAFTGTQAVTVAIDAGTNAITLTTVAKGDDKFIALSSVVAADGDGATTSTLGLTSAASTAGTPAVTGSSATIVGTGAFTGTQTLGDNDTVSFTVSLDGTPTAITIDKARVNTALGVTTGTIGSAADYVTVLNSALTAAGVAATATQTAGAITLTKTSAAGVGTIAVSGVGSSAGADTISIATIDISDTALTAAGVTTGEQRKAVLSAYISVVRDAIKSVTSEASKLGSVSSRIELQNTFVDTLIDTIEAGVGNLIDADLSEESTRLQALQTKQQLGIQALSIANSSTQNVLALFQ